MITNEELIKRIKSGEKYLIDELYENVKKLVFKEANDFYRKNKHLINNLQSIDYDDIVQSANISFIKSIKGYSFKKETLYSTYLVYTIQQNLYTEFYPNKKVSNKFQKELNSCPYEDTWLDNKSKIDIDNKILIEQLMIVLDEKEKNIILDKYIMGLNKSELMNKYGVTYTTIRNKINRALEKMRKEAERNGL